MPRYRSLLFALVLFASLGAAPAQAVLPEWLGGKLILDHYESVGPGRDARGDGNGTLQSGLTLYGKATPEFSETVSGKAVVRVSAFRRSVEKGRASALRAEAQEAWLRRSAGGLEVKVGQIVTPWGRSDAVNPTDFLTADDLTFQSTSDELRRRGAPGARAIFVPNQGDSPLEFTLAWNARYPQTKMLIPATGVPAGLTVDQNGSTPHLLGDRQEWALKAAFLTPAYDFSVSAFTGRNHFGQFYWDGSKISLLYEKTKALGADFSYTFNAFVLRGETAYYFYDSGKRGTAGYSLTEPNHWDSVLGLERGLGERVRFVVQALYRVHPSLRNSDEYVGPNLMDTAIRRGVGQANALIQNYQSKTELGATLLVSYATVDEEWVFDLGAMGNFLGGDFVIRPKISHELRDSLHATLGMDYYGGPPDQSLGALRDYRSAYLEAVLDF